MADVDLILKKFLTSKWGIAIFTASISFLVLKRLTRRVYPRLYAEFLVRVDGNLMKSKKITAIKQELFSAINTNSTIVEIGAGTGTNFSFYPENCSVICVEPKVIFESYVGNSTKARGGHLKSVEFREGVGENLSSVFEADSVDYVTCSLVLCSVHDVRTIAEQIKTILKPGGKFMFFEHVLASEESPWIRRYHRVMDSKFSLYGMISDNCHLGREPWVDIEAAGFSKVDWKRCILKTAYPFSCLRTVGVGTATK